LHRFRELKLRVRPRAREGEATEAILDGPEGLAISSGVGLLVLTVAGLASAWAGVYSPWVAGTAFAIANLLTLRLLRCRVRSGWDTWTVATLGALAGVLLLNIIFFGEHIEPDRDPGLYWYKAMNLAESGGLFASSNEGPFRGSEIVLERTGGGFDGIPGTYKSYVQFLSAPAVVSASLVPAFGWSAPMAASALLLFLAAFALALVARRATAPQWGFVAALSAAVSLPWIYFGRLPYSEPLSVAFLTVGFAALTSGAMDRAPARFVVGATLIGSAALARVDAGIAISGALLAAIAIGRLQGFGSKHLTTSIFATSLGTAIAVADLQLTSPVYLAALQGPYTSVILLHAATLGVALTIALWDFGPIRRFMQVTILRRAAVGFVACWALLWFMGPHILELRDSDIAYNQGPLQTREGFAQDVGRTYGERLPQRLAISVGALIPGLALLALLRSWRKSTLVAAGPLLAAGLATTAVYSFRASITPDMVWALRRLIPVIIPAFVLLAVVGLSGLLLGKTRNVVAACVLLVSVASTSAPIVVEKERDGTMEAVRAICARLPQGSAALFLAGPVDRLARPAEVGCDVPVAVGVAEPKLEELVALQRGWQQEGYKLVVVAATPRLEVGPSLVIRSAPIKWVDRRLEKTLVRRPEQILEDERTLWMYSFSGSSHLSGVS
jgi:xanthosine utilization system XapX-like protein